jgi:hypothetical protein
MMVRVGRMVCQGLRDLVATQRHQGGSKRRAKLSIYLIYKRSMAVRSRAMEVLKTFDSILPSRGPALNHLSGAPNDSQILLDKPLNES